MNKNFKVDFLCDGFNKCGTTTLETLMKLNSDITIPEPIPKPNRPKSYFL